jgi:peptidoglycan/LPS O-acetylase OafA/YrhL
MGAVVGASRAELRGLTGIRALAAGWVVVEHFRLVLYALFPGVEGVLNPWIRSGYLGVEVFFVLSGFIIAYNYADRFATFTWSAYRRFLELRFARIYPVQLVTLVGLGLIVLAARAMGISLSGESNYTIGSFIGNVFNLQALPGIASFNNPAWSISTEFAAYLAFPLIALWLVRLSSPTRAFVASAVLAVVGVTCMLLVAAFVNESPTGEAMIWLRIAFEFTIGCCLFAGWRWLKDRRFGKTWDWTAAASLLVLVVVLGFVGGGEGSLALVTVPVIAVLVLSLAGATGWIASVFGSRVMMWGGRISYSVYMTHFILLMVLGEILPAEKFADSNPLVRVGVMAIYYLLAVGVGAVCYYIVEEPARKAIRRFIARRAGTKPLAIREDTQDAAASRTDSAQVAE